MEWDRGAPHNLAGASGTHGTRFSMVGMRRRASAHQPPTAHPFRSGYRLDICAADPGPHEAPDVPSRMAHLGPLGLSGAFLGAL